MVGFKFGQGRSGFHLIALIATVALVFGSAGIAFASISTDQADYSPGSTVTISGNGDGFAVGYTPG